MHGSKKKLPDAPRDGAVTSLATKGTGAGRVVVYLEGSRAFEVAVAVADREGLRVGQKLSVEAQDRLVKEDAAYRARERALRFLSLRDRSCHEVDTCLRQAGFDADVSAETVAWLRQLGYLDDERFATRYAGEKAKGGWGERRVRAELQRKGVPRGAVKAAFEAIDADEGTETASFEAVVALVQRRFSGQFESDRAGASRRLAGFLGRRGYDWDTIQRVTRELSEEAAQSDGPSLP